jgi:squalene-hopene/tetraprenyl-beta-curcumene cyclase
LETEVLGLGPRRLVAAFETVRYELLAEREPSGHWIGELSASALSTATAVSALALVERHSPTDPSSGRLCNERESSRFCELIVGGLHWLAKNQNADGGWGDTPGGQSNIATTMLVQAAFHLTGVPAGKTSLLERAEAYVELQGGLAGLRKRYGDDKTFAVPILTNCALAGLVSWKQVPSLPFEAACLPNRFYRFIRLPVVSYAIPALVAIGQAKFHHRPPANPALRWLRSSLCGRSLSLLETLQPESGGYLEATPLTSFVVMSLASIGRTESPVVQNGVKFLIDSVRPDGSWPIDTNLATWNTTLAINALAAAGEDVSELGCLEWLLSCQHRQRHRYTDAAPGGWGWSDLSGAVPDADDTAGALLALAHLDDGRDLVSSGEASPLPCTHINDHSSQRAAQIREAAFAGVRWLLDLQNRDGGWPTFCRGWGALPFDRSGSDLTAHALRALASWRGVIAEADADLQRVQSAIERGLAYMAKTQRPDGSWLPLWFGNQWQPEESNRVYGTAKVLFAYRDLGLRETPEAKRGFEWLLSNQSASGGWGGRPKRNVSRSKGGNISAPFEEDSVEETSLAIEALLSAPPAGSVELALKRGLRYLVGRVEEGRLSPSPIGFYFAKLWYHEKLYPLSFAASALGCALRRLEGGGSRLRVSGSRLRVNCRPKTRHAAIGSINETRPAS